MTARFSFTRRALARVAAIALLAGFGAAAAQAQELRIGMRAGPEAMDPQYMALGNHAAPMKNMYDPLVWVDEQLQVQPGLAESWRVVDDTTWEFRLRRNVVFHDGSPFTAADVKFSIERVPRFPGPDGGLTLYTRLIAGVDVVDDFTVRIRTNGPHAALPQDMTRMFIISSRIGADANTEAFNTGRAAIGTGPFRYVSWTPRGDLVMARHDRYWRGRPHWERVTMVEISNDAARVAALLSGRVDFINYVPASDVARVGRERNMSVFAGQSIYNFLLYPHQHETHPSLTDKNGQPLPRNPFRDVRVRQALSLAIDRDAIAERVLEGQATPARQLMNNTFFGADPNAPPLPFNLDRARQLLTEAGYPNGFRVPLHCSSDRLPGDGAVCAALGQLLARIGIEVQVNAQSRTVFFPARTRGDYVFTMAGWGTLTGEAGYALTGFVHTNDRERRLGPFNNTGYSNPQIDEVIRQGLATLDDNRRSELYRQAQRMAVADGGAIPIVILNTAWAGRTDRVRWAPRIDEDTLAYYIQPAQR